MVWFIVYIVIYAFIAGWMYGCDGNELWYFFALFWPLLPICAIILGIGYISYRVKRYFDGL